MDRIVKSLKKLFHRIREAMEDGMRQQITLAGFIFSLLIVMVGLAAFASANNLLFLLLAALLSTLLISGFVSRLGLASLELDLSLPQQIAAGRKQLGYVILKNAKFLPSFSLHLKGAKESGFVEELYVPVLAGRATLREPLQLLFSRRGLYKENTFSLTSRFPFGFTQRRAQLRLQRDVLVYPCIDAQTGFEQLLQEVSGDISSRLRGRGSDFYRIRPYEVLESARHVDWRATAHTGELQVREFARDQDLTVTVMLDLVVPEDRHEWFEKAVDYCAFLVWRLGQKDLRVRFVTQQFDRTVPEEADVYAILRYLALVTPIQGTKPPSAFHDDHTIQVAVSARPSTLEDAGWEGARVVSLPELAPAIANPYTDNSGR